MKDVFVGQDGMASETVEEGLEHPLPLGDHGMVFPCLGLLDRIVSEGLFGRDGRNDERWVQFDEVQTQRLEIRIAMPRFDALTPERGNTLSPQDSISQQKLLRLC